MCHLVYFFKFLDGFDDDWYRDNRLALELATPGVERVRSWKTLYAERQVYRPPNEFDRMTEVRFANLKAAETALCRPDSLWDEAGRRGLDRFEGIVVGPRHEYNLMADVPPQQYPYMSMPMLWRKGRPADIPVPETSVLVRYMYFFRYKDGADIRQGEDWYLGHHTREGKQLPGIQTYVTWRRKPIAGLAGHIPELARFYRYTEIGYESIEYQQLGVNLESTKYTPSLHSYDVVAWDAEGFRNFYIPEDPDIELARK
jgi:hypothetical protein